MTTRKNNYCSQSKNNHSKSWKSKDNQITNKVDSASLAISACSCAKKKYSVWADTLRDSGEYLMNYARK